MAYTLQDFVKLNPSYAKRYDPSTKTAYLSNAKTGKEISFGLGQGQQYGLGGVAGGSHTISDPGRLISALSGQPSQPYQAPQQSTPPQNAYQSPYSAQIGQTLAAMQNRPAFNYNPSADQGLQAAQETTMDAVSRAAARRGMLYSDSSKSQMGKAALELVPQFEQTAYNRYAQQGQDIYSQLAALNELESQTYGRYRDTVGDTRSQEESDYNRLMQQMEMGQGQEDTDYNRLMQQMELKQQLEKDNQNSAWEQYKWENMSPADQQKILLEQGYDWQKAQAIIAGENTRSGANIGAANERFYAELPLKQEKTLYDINKPYYKPDSTKYTTNDYVSDLIGMKDYYSSTEDYTASIIRNQANIVKQVGTSGYNYLLKQAQEMKFDPTGWERKYTVKGDPIQQYLSMGG